MNQLTLSNKPYRVALLTTVLTSLLSVSTQAEILLRVEEQTATHGWNKRYEMPIHEYDDIGTFGFQTMRIYNPDGVPLPITEETSLDSLISTYFDPLTGLPIAHLEALSSNANAPKVNDFPLVYLRDGVSREPVGGHLNVGQMDNSLSWPHDDVTLGEWMEAKGTLTFRCDTETGENWVQIEATGLLPNRLYSLWDWYHPDQTKIPPGIPSLPVTPDIPGGIGSEMMADLDGRASYRVRTSHCYPQNVNVLTPTRGIVFITHWDQQTYGANPVVPFHPAYPILPGEAGAIQLFWASSGGARVINN